MENKYTKEELEDMYPRIDTKRLKLALSLCLIVLIVAKFSQMKGLI